MYKVASPPGGRNRIKLLGKKFKWGKRGRGREGKEEEGREGEVGRKGKGRQGGKEGKSEGKRDKEKRIVREGEGERQEIVLRR